MRIATVWLSCLLILLQSCITAFSTAKSVSSCHDDQMVELQLGYLPPNYSCVSARLLHDGITPVAIQTHPLHHGGGSARRRRHKISMDVNGQDDKEISETTLLHLTPFPTLFWLANREISKAISGLERQGFIAELEARLSEESRFRNQLWESHRDYASQRWASLSEEQRQVLVSSQDSTIVGMKRMLHDSGIAGTNYRQHDETTFASIKCLHAHYAHYRSNLDRNKGEKERYVNPIGCWTHQLLLERYPNVKL